jgi:hypothetical protein
MTLDELIADMNADQAHAGRPSLCEDAVERLRAWAKDHDAQAYYEERNAEALRDL